MVEGDCIDLFQESGGHRIQRVSPTEKRGRVHTSTVTVAVIEYSRDKSIEIKDSDIKLEWFSGNIGAGGQHRNKHANSARITHLPTGIVSTSQGRDRQANLKEAKENLIKKINSHNSTELRDGRQSEIRTKMGSGQRGDKIRTYRFQDSIVKNHLNEKKAHADKIMKGHISLLWD